jgi:CHAT domain-containing protein/tetratricopeptide (TPR) repeat protein
MTRWRSVIVCCAMAALLASGASPRTAARAQEAAADFDALLATAQKAYNDKRWELAASTYRSIRDRAREQGDERWAARGRLGTAAVDLTRGRYTDARTEALEALAVFERLGDLPLLALANDTLSRIAFAIADFAEASARAKTAIQLFDAAGDRPARLRAAVRLYSLKGPASRDTIDRQATELLAEIRALGERRLEGTVLHSWADGLFTLGEYEAAIEKLEAAVAVFEQHGDTESLATTYTSLGRLYRVHGQPEAAVKYQLKSLELAERSSTPRTLVQSLNAVGVAYEAVGDVANAGAYYERALAAAEKTGSASMLEVLRANLGDFAVHNGDAERARVLLEEVVAHGTEAHLGMRYDQLSTAYFVLGRYDEALAAARHAVELCTATTPLDCIYAQMRVADAEFGLKHDTAALAAQQTALASLEEMHAKLAASDFLKQEFHHAWEPVYSFGIQLHFSRGEYREALENAELARSRGFLDLLASRHIDPQPRTVPEMSALTLRGAAAATTIRSQGVAAASNADDLAAVAARLHSTIVAYWVARDTLYAWVIAPDGTVTGAKTAVAAVKLDRLIRATSPFAPTPDGRVPAATTTTRGAEPIALAARRNPAWRQLYDLLITPIEHDLPRSTGARLTFVPHGPLLHLPFAALRDARGRYLVERYAIHSVPAVAMLQFTTPRHANARAGSLLLVADPASPPTIAGEPPLPRLPGAVEEARAIARLVPAARTMLLADTSATEVRVRDALPRHSVVHFATHALVRDTDPMSSFLALGTSRGNDGRLTAEKIYRLQLDADLVVLSACRSGGGLFTGDGIAGLARAFFYAGAPSLVVSLWDVADAPTSRLVPAFYRAWLGGADKARALRTAQLGLIRDLRAGRVTVATPAGPLAIPEDPAFWAGFILLGEPE